MTALDVARYYLNLHDNDPHKALWHSKRLECRPEPLPRECFEKQTGVAAWIAASCDLAGVHLLASGGEVQCVKWAEVMA